MGETAGSCGIVNQRIVAMDMSPFCSNSKRMIKKELHKNEPAQKDSEFGLSNASKNGLLTYKAGEVLDWFNNMGTGSVCYSA